ncbi:MAG: hypothetical protein NV1_07 [Nanoarchaeotal virus 1]|nr:MAG: hypothetical protein NV1_07 [Nanoarchaeotal virus 1]
MDPRIISSLVIIGGTAVELALIWDLGLFSNELLKYLAGILVVLDVLALLKILLNI